MTGGGCAGEAEEVEGRSDCDDRMHLKEREKRDQSQNISSFMLPHRMQSVKCFQTTDSEHQVVKLTLIQCSCNLFTVL